MQRFAMNYLFGPHSLHNSQIFFETKLSLAIVNIKPIVPGHVLVIPKRVESRLMNLTPEEYNDLFLAVRTVAPKLENHFGAHAMNIAVQDGAASGQSVPHVHVHILPRKKGMIQRCMNSTIYIYRILKLYYTILGDFSRNDDVYDELEQQNLHEVFHHNHRRTKSVDEMGIECDVYKSLFSLHNFS